ncbi:carbohydrate kinase [Peteryoungia desertarenae]|uniref:Carbohydrate kinase n=1 Tax=Peteryoungia desertarenae TaxID=1813451 RepID=A0ABX6QR61_9HYPH|nr:carbohydrate kinase family protein [Peteryoungia desertarenae]QLF70697.1 carbohydrate kinase [Peteryoungia desertarenae]
MNHSILVLGGAHLDRRGQISGRTFPGASNPGRFTEEAGGGGFNAARNLARLGHEVAMIAPRGGDQAGETVRVAAEEAGVAYVPLTFLDRVTPSYTAILEADGNLVIAVADMDLYRQFTPRRLRARTVRNAMNKATALICDANLSAETLQALSGEASTRQIPLYAIAISPAKVERFRGCLGGLTTLFMNEAEAEVVAGQKPTDPHHWPELLRNAGLNGGVVTRGDREAIAFNPREVAVLAPPRLKEIADVTGAGDSFASGFISASLSGATTTEALRHATAAAIITLRSPQAASSALSTVSLHRTLQEVPVATQVLNPENDIRQAYP